MLSDMGKTTVTPQQRKDGPSFQDVGLWRRLLTRAQEGNLTNHHFFVIDVVESCLHSSMFCTLVFDANNNFKGRVLASPERRGDRKVKVVSQAGMQQRKEASVAEKTKTKPDVQVQAQRQGTKNPLLYFDTETVNFGTDRTPRKVDANPALRADLPSVPRSKVNGKDIIQISDSSEEEDDDEYMPLKPINWDGSVRSTIRVGASGIKMRPKETISRCSNKVTRVDAEDQTQATPDDVSDCIKRQTPRQSSRLAEMAELNNLTQKHVQSDEDQSEGIILLGNGSIRDIMLGKYPASRSPPSSVSAPSSSEHVTVLKRSRKLQRKTGCYEGDDADYTPSAVRLGNLFKLSQEMKERKAALRSENVSVPGVNAECNPVETPTVKSKRDAVASKANKAAESEILAEQSTKRQPSRVQQVEETSSKMIDDAKIRSPDNKKKKAPENLPKGMKRTPETPLGQPATEVLNATQSVAGVVAGVVADVGAAEAMPRENGGSKVIQSAAPQVPGGVGSRAPVKSRHKVKVYKDRGEKKGEKSCPRPEEPRPLPEELRPPPEKSRPLSGEETKVVYKRPTKIARISPVKVHKIMYISRRRPVTDQERKDILVKAQDYAQKSMNKHYVMQLRVSQVYCGYHLGVLPAFVEALQLPLVREKMTFFDVTGKTWEVDWQGDHPQKPGFNSIGWTKFVLDHCLEEGDVCVFELPDPKVFNISVTIFPIVPLAKIPELGWKSHYGGEHTGEKSELPAQSQS